MVSTRPDISYAISVLSIFMSNLDKEHWLGMKWLLRYLNGSSEVGLIYEKRGKTIWLEGYSNLYYGADIEKKRSITSYFFQLKWVLYKLQGSVANCGGSFYNRGKHSNNGSTLVERSFGRTYC